MFRYHPTFKFIQLHKKLSDAIENGSDLYRLKTEDGVEVRKIYIKLVDTALGVEEITFLLSVYGPIEAIKVFGKNTNTRRKMKNRGFVTFTKGCDASSALINRKKFSELFVMKPADTWNQPDYDNSSESTHEEVLGGCNSQLFAMLNDDCLLHVFNFLDVFDVLSVRKVCRKFDELGEIHFKTVKTLDFGSSKTKKKLTLHETKLILKTVGPNITTATINSDKFYDQRILSFIPKYLKKVKHLHLSGFKLEAPEFWYQMANILSSLETLDLSDNSEINENFLKSFKKTQSRLKALNVSNCNINGNFLDLIANIEILNISGCRFIHGKELITFVDKNKKLKSLNISKCPNIYGKDVNEMLMKMSRVEVLALNNYYIDDETSRFVIPSIQPLVNLRELTIQNINFPPCDQLLRTIYLQNKIEMLDISYGNLTLTSVYAISTMKKLKKLVMNFKNSVPEDLVDFLLDLKNIEEIHISGCSHIAPENALRLLFLPKLWLLDISRCFEFTNEFIIDAVQKLNETLPRRRFKMIVGQTEIEQNVLDTPEMRNHCHLLELTWEATKDVEHDYDIDEENKYCRNEQQVNQLDCYTTDDIINILSNLDDCDSKLVETIKSYL